LNLSGCDGFITITIIILVGQILIVQAPFLNSFFNVVPLKMADWGIIIVGSALVMIVRELFQIIKNICK